MEQIRTYEIDGVVLRIPLSFDERSGRHIEDYTEFIENQVFTPCGFPIMFAGEDACEFSQEESPGGCPDCGSCSHYRRAGEHTWIGICRCEQKKNKLR